MRPIAALALGLALCSACKPDVGMVGGDPLDMMSSADLPWTAMDQGGDQAINECAAVESVGRQEPAAMLVVLDRSSSMKGSKWTAAVQAIQQAIDLDAFDFSSLGLMMVPSGSLTGPACIFNLPVSCRAPAAPQVALADAGTAKTSAASGVRATIKTTLANTSVDNGLGDASPLYAGLNNAIAALQSYQVSPNGGGKRILLVVSDGTLSCGQLANRPGFSDCNQCDHDWEDPNNIVSLVSMAKKDALKPIDTFMVGVPGSDTYDPSGCNEPPYYMRLALSAIGYAGSPENAPAGCTGKTFTQAGGDPAMSCHFDMTQGNFNAAALASVISTVRGKVQGCTYELPTVDGGTVDRAQVNVSVTINGQKTSAVRRRNANDTCLDRACWDYNAQGKIDLVGKLCTDVKNNGGAQVRIGVGCATVLG